LWQPPTVVLPLAALPVNERVPGIYANSMEVKKITSGNHAIVARASRWTASGEPESAAAVFGNQTEILQGHHINQTESKIGLNAFERATAAAKI
jgi:hypothetical protein